MVFHYPPKFGDNRDCGNGNILLLAVVEQDSTCSLKHFITIYLKAICQSYLSQNIYLKAICQCDHEVSSVLVTYGYSNNWQNFCRSPQKHCREKEKVEKKKISYCKDFGVTSKPKKLKKRVKAISKLSRKTS